MLLCLRISNIGVSMDSKKYFLCASVIIILITLALFCKDDSVGECMIDLNDQSIQAYEYCVEVTK